MNAFKNDKRQGTIMHQIAKGYTDAEITQMAAYFAAQKPSK
jgi:cytochrome c553